MKERKFTRTEAASAWVNYMGGIGYKMVAHGKLKWEGDMMLHQTPEGFTLFWEPIYDSIRLDRVDPISNNTNASSEEQGNVP
jgi:hypothetical protein